MKKFIAILLLILCIIQLAGCGTPEKPSETETATAQTSESSESVSRDKALDNAIYVLTRELKKRGYDKYLDYSKFSITSEEGGSHGYVFYGKIYLYDQYNDFKGDLKFCVNGYANDATIVTLG